MQCRYKLQKTHNMEFNMKIIIRIIGTFLAIVKLSTASDLTSENPNISNTISEKVKNISIGNLLDFKQISGAIEDEFDKARFYYIIAYEIDRRNKELDEKFLTQEKKYQKSIRKYENELNLTPYQYVDEHPRYDYEYQSVDISEETISKDIHRIQAELARTQFIQGYKYYRRRLDNYKNYLIALRELYKHKAIKSKGEQIEYYSNFPEMYQDLKLFHDSMDNAGKMKVQRDILGKVLYIDWQAEDESDLTRRREFEYHDDGLLSKLTDTINDQVIFETLFGEIELGEKFFEYIFSPGFIPQNYNYYTEVFYQNNRASAYKFTSMNGHVIGTIYKEFDKGDHLIREAWCKGETSKILREFTSTFDPKTGDYKLIERDRNGKIVNQEVVLSSVN
mgnify:CR=1 FL=1